MSTDRSRLVSSIRRIVLTDPDLSSALDAWQNRGDQASSTGVGTSDAERDRLCCDGSTSDNPNPGADTRDTSEGGQDGLNADDPALLDSGPGSLTGVTDCATGETICFDGNDWLPPEGWDCPTCPPIEPYYEEGFYWHISSGGTTYTGTTPCRAVAELRESQGSFIENCRVTLESSEDQVTVTYDLFDAETGELQTADATSTVFRESCETAFDPACDEPAPTADAWPADGCTNLAIKSGTIVGSKYDPENDGSYSKPMSEIELCDGSGNSFFLSPAANGGWKTIDATKTDGYLYDNNGKKIAHIDGNEYSDPDV